MKKKNWWTRERLRNLFTGIYSILILLILVFALLSTHGAVNGESEAFAKTFLFLTFISLSTIRGVQLAYILLETKKNKITIIKFSSLAIIYLALAIVIVAIYKPSMDTYRVISTLYLSSIVINRVFIMLEKKKTAYYIFNSFLIVITLVVLALFLLIATIDIEPLFIALLMMIVILSSLVEVLAFSFSKIQLKGLLKIIRKTYVFEILYGLIILIIASSFYFMVMDDSIPTFWDGLWYSFAVVTTIGFGDLSVKDPISRILSVVLGIYGIIVVASITSVIVNYYNEVRTADIEKKVEKEVEKKLEERKEENVSEEEKKNED